MDGTAVREGVQECFRLCGPGPEESGAERLISLTLPHHRSLLRAVGVELKQGRNLSDAEFIETDCLTLHGLFSMSSYRIWDCQPRVAPPTTIIN